MSRKNNSDFRRVFDLDRPDFPKGTPFWKDVSFNEATERNAIFQQIESLLPDIPGTEMFRDQQQVNSLSSSYLDHGYGNFFYALARVLKPTLCVEMGILHGFSLLNVASALRDNGVGTIHGLDLFEDYPYRHGNYAELRDNVATLGLSNIVEVDQADGFENVDRFEKLDLLHVDISNNGDTFRKTFDLWAGKVGSVIVLEGGSQTRDQIDWMLEYRKPPIHPVLEKIKVDYPQWSIFVLEPFPSMTVALRNE
jgi:predicted O-methyltransferase YrrM